MKPKIGDTVQFKKSGIKGTVEKILRGVCIVDTPVSKLTAWPEDLIICGLSEVSLDKEMEEHQRICDEIMEIQGIKPIEAEMEQIIHCPEGYEFKDENGNVINATKIVLEKKKPKYPKTYEECCKVLGIDPLGYDAGGYKWVIISMLQTLLVCRDAYWSLAGDWKPNYDSGVDKFGIICYDGVVQKSGAVSPWERHCNKILDFPTPEMRDAFYQNFKGLINQCKELL